MSTPFSIDIIARCWGWCYYIPWIAPLYAWMLSKAESSIIFLVFGKTWPGIEPQSPGPLVNTLLIRPMAHIYIYIYKVYLATVEEDTTPFPGLLHFTLDTYLTMLSVKLGGIIFWVFGITWSWIETLFPGPLVNTLPTWQITQYQYIYIYIYIYIVIYVCVYIYIYI